MNIVSTQKDMQRGLSYKEVLPKGQGMLFSYNKQSKSCMWMKDMNFPLDVYWFDGAGKLVSTISYIYPESYPRSYCSERPASYMLEVNAGEFENPPTMIIVPKQ